MNYRGAGTNKIDRKALIDRAPRSLEAATGLVGMTALSGKDLRW